jgi:hypothetical protein
MGVFRPPTGEDPMQEEMALVDRGRGLQLSTRRTPDQDLVPDFQNGCWYDEIVLWIPSLTRGGIATFEGDCRQHKDELDEYERRVQAYRAGEARLQRLRFRERKVSRDERLARLRELLEQ